MGKPLSLPAQRETLPGRFGGPLRRLRGEGLWLALVLVGLALLAGRLLPLAPDGGIAADFGLALPCVFHLVTELPCPLCGMTRAFANLTRLQFVPALTHSPAGVALYGLLAAYLVLGWLYVLTGWRVLRPWLLRRDYLGWLAFITILGWPFKLWLQAGITP